jgi:hypothetical protein
MFWSRVVGWGVASIGKFGVVPNLCCEEPAITAHVADSLERGQEEAQKKPPPRDLRRRREAAGVNILPKSRNSGPPCDRPPLRLGFFPFGVCIHNLLPVRPFA